MWFKLSSGKHINLAHVAYLLGPISGEGGKEPFFKLAIPGAQSVRVSVKEAESLFAALDSLSAATVASIPPKQDDDLLQTDLSEPLMRTAGYTGPWPPRNV